MARPIDHRMIQAYMMVACGIGATIALVYGLVQLALPDERALECARRGGIVVRSQYHWQCIKAEEIKIMIKAEIVTDSVSPEGKRLTTFKLRYPWFIHGEAKTHRILRLTDEGGYELIQEVGLMDDQNLSRNASSNRAIPLAKMLEEVRSDELRAAPVFWGGEQKGMEPAAELDDITALLTHNGMSQRRAAQFKWKCAALNAADSAQQLGDLGLHKSLCNRLLMPFTHANVVVTATEWDNFFGLRLDSAADPTMRALAEAMWAAMGESKPDTLQPGQWHLPFVDDHEPIGDLVKADRNGDEVLQRMIRVSVARCARVSYESHETGRRSAVEEDLKLYDRLLGSRPLHASPAEHQATPLGAPPNDIYNREWEKQKAEQGNFVGWRQYRKMLPGEDKAPLPEEYRS